MSCDTKLDTINCTHPDALRPEEPRKKKGRPSGSDADAYKGWQKWSYRRWAWEFLRRNEIFQEECKRVNASNSEEERCRVASEFGLRSYKSYTEAYKGKSGYPRFTIGLVTSISHLDVDQDNNRKVRSELKPGHVLIRFDLSSALSDIHVLEKQIRMADNRLKRLLRSYETKLKVRSLVKKHSVSTFLDYLRLLDAQADGKTQIEAALMIDPKKERQLSDSRNNITKESLAPAASKKLRRATEYTTELYRYLAVLKGRPNIKSVPLEE